MFAVKDFEPPSLHNLKCILCIFNAESTTHYTDKMYCTNFYLPQQ